MIKRIFGLIAVLAVLALGTSVFGAAFTGGNIVVYRVGDGSQPVTNLGQTVFLDEYTTNQIIANAGCGIFCTPLTPVQSIQMPGSWVGNQAPLIADGAAQIEGVMNLSLDGRYLVVPGFAASVGQLTNLTGYAFPGISSNADISSSYATNAVTEADVPRVVGLVDGNGHIYTSTTITNGTEDGDEIRTAASLDGTNIWYAGGDGKVVKYTIRGTLTSTQVCANTALEPARAVGIFGSGSGKAVYVDKSTVFAVATNTTAIYTNIVGGVTNVATVNPFGGALPVVTYPTNFVQIAPVTNGSQMAFVMFNLANANQSGAAPDTLYLADSAANFIGESRNFGGAVEKYCYVSGSWVYEGAIGAEDAFGVAGYQNGTNVALYITEGTNSYMYYYNDTTGYNPYPGNPQEIAEAPRLELNLGNSGSVSVRGVCAVPQGGDSGTLTGGPGITIGPPYAPYFRGPQGGPFTPANGVTYSVANLSANAGSFSINFSGTSFLTATPSSGSLAAGASTPVTFTTSANATNQNGGQSYTESIHLHTGGIGGTIVNNLTATLVVDAFYLTPTTNFISLGEPGGPFTPSSTIYVLSNATVHALSYYAFTSNNWTSLTAPSAAQLAGNIITGTVPGFATANITVSINANANSLGIGTYDDQLTVTNVSAATALTTMPGVRLQVGFGIFDDFSTYTPGNVVGQNNWNGGTVPPDVNPVQILTIVDGTNCVGCLGGTNEYVVPGGCAGAPSTAQQPYKYVWAGPVTNAMYVCGTNVVASTNVYIMCNVPTYAVTGILVTFTNAPTQSNYIFEQGSTFLGWNDAGVEDAGGGQYSWTTELDQYQTGGGPEGSATYNYGQQYQVYFITDFTESNAWVFVNPPSPSIDPSAQALVNDPNTNSFQAVYSNGAGADNCPGADCIGNSAQGWESITLGQYLGDCPNGVEPGYFVTRVAASTNYVDVYNWLNGISSSPTDPFTSWENAYFTSAQLTNPAVSGANVDLFGTGMSNTNKFLAGFSGSNPSAYLHIISVGKAVAAGQTNVTVTYLGANGDSTYMPGFASRTNILEYSTGTGNGSYTNNFLPTGQTNVLSGGTGLGTVTNMTDSAIPASSTRYYRVRVLLP